MSREQLTAPATAPEGAGGEDLPRGPAGSTARRAWQRVPAGLLYSLAVYAITRIPFLVAVGLFLRDHPGSSIDTIALRWDGYWYTHIARDGYSTSLRSPVDVVGPAHHTLSDWAFFPGYPLLVRGVAWATRIPLVPASILVAALLGALAVWAVYALGCAVGGVRVARGAALLFAAWPGSAVLDLPYTEGLFLAAAAAGLACLAKRQWVLAGLLGAVASATRPNGLAFVAAAGVAAVLAIAREREWRALLAPALSVTGMAAFVVYGWQRTGDLLAWRHAENLWHQRLDFNSAVLRTAIGLLGDMNGAVGTEDGRVALAGSLLRVLGLLLVVATLAAAWANRRRLSLPVVVYAAASLALILGYSTVSTRPRMLLTVLPAFVWLAAWLPRRAVVALSICLLPLLGIATYFWAGGVTP